MKERRYGEKRILDSSRNVKNEFLRKFGLDYGIRLRWYVEGDTEHSFLDGIFGGNSVIEVVNLRGTVSDKKKLGFGDSLRFDSRSRVFSFISIDGDLGHNLRAVRRAAKADEMCGRFFINAPDFEFANFTVEELTQVAWEIAIDNGAPQEERKKLFQATVKTNSKTEFLAAAKRAVMALSHFSTNKVWGEKLMRFAGDNRRMVLPDGTTKRRPVVEAVRAAIDTVNAGYYFIRTEYNLDPVTGGLVRRSPSM